MLPQKDLQKVLSFSSQFKYFYNSSSQKSVLVGCKGGPTMADGFASVDEALKDFQAGKMLILVDHEDRENEGDLVIAAEHCTAESINFMAKYARGLICVPLTQERLQQLQLRQMVDVNTEHLSTAFTISVDAKHNTSTGISTADRAETVRALINPTTKPDDLRRPGHIFPLQAKQGGVLVRAGQTEGSIDLCRLAGLYPGAVICEVMNDDGTMARGSDLQAFSKQHTLKMLSIAQIIEYRRRHEQLIHRESEAQLPTEFGQFKILSYSNVLDSTIHLALVCGNPENTQNVLVRVHSECLTGEVFSSMRCDCGEQLRNSLRMIADEGAGVCLYMRQEGRGIGLHAKIKAYQLQDQGFDTVQANEKLGFQADLRDYGLAAQILKDLGLSSLRLLTNNPKKLTALQGYDLSITERIPILIAPRQHNKHYLKTKQDKLGHFLNLS